MKNSSGWFIRSLTLFASGLPGFAITAGIAVIGGGYLWQCYQYILSPQVPIEFEYKAENGPATIRAKRYVLDPFRKSISLIQPDIKTSSKIPSVSAESLQVELGSNLIRVAAHRLHFNLVRDKNSQFNLSSILPKSQPGVYGPTILFESPSATISYADEAHPDVAKQVSLQNTRLVQDQGTTVASTQLTGLDLGAIPLNIQLGEKGKLFISAQGINGQVRSVLPLIDSFIDDKARKTLDQFQIDKASVKGSVELASNGTEPLDIRGNLNVDIPGFQYNKGQIAGNLTGTVSGSLSRAKLAAKLVDGARSADFDGVVSVNDSPNFAGSFALKFGGSPWPIMQKQLPKSLSLNGGNVTGAVAFANNKLDISGLGKLKNARWEKESLKAIDAQFHYSGTSLALALKKANWQGGNVQGFLQTDIKSGKLVGAVSVPSRDINSLLAKAGVDWLRGKASAQAIIRGSVSKPLVAIRASGNASVKVSDTKWIPAGPFELQASTEGKNALLERFTVSGPNGLLIGSGKANLATKKLDGSFTIGDIPLSLFGEDVSGTLFAKGNIGGTTDKPEYSAHVEGYGLQYKETGVAVVTSEISGTREKLFVNSLLASSGTGSITAKGELGLKDKSLNGSFGAQNIAISDILGSDYLGMLEAKSGKISGTLDNPNITAELSGKSLNAFGITVDSISTQGKFQNSVASFQDLFVGIGNGSVQGAGTYDVNKKTGKFETTLKNVEIDKILHPSAEVDVQGKLDGVLGFEFRPDVIESKGTVDVKDVTVNGTLIGGGEIAISGAQNALKIQGAIGSIDRFISLDAMTLDATTKDFSADFSAYNMRLRDILDAGKPLWNNPGQASQDILESIDGSFTGSSSISSKSDSWELGKTEMSVDGFSVSGRDAGKLNAKVDQKGNLWTVSELTWASKDGNLELNGTLDGKGQLTTQANLTNFDLSWIKTLFPDTQLVTGRASATVVASGPKDDPTGRASVFIDQAVIGSSAGSASSEPIQFLLDNINFGNKKLDLTGQASYQGFTGLISANIPYSSLSQESLAQRRDPLSATINFKDRPLQDFKDQLPNVDMEKSSGNVQLFANINGYIDDLKILANAKLDSDRIVANGMDTEIKNLHVTYAQKDRSAQITGSLESSLGGLASFDVTGNLANVFGSDFNVDDLLEDSTVKGKVEFKNFAFTQKLPGAVAPTTVRTDGKLGIAGRMRTPTISGGLSLDQIVVNLPNEVAAGTPTTFSINPEFDNVRLSIASGSKIETGVGALNVLGFGTIRGSLSDPFVSVPLTLEAGTFRLPSGRISLEPGGGISLTYASIAGGDPVPRVILDLEGHTTVVSKAASGQYEPYQITVNIRGNVLDENNLLFTATSDPPDLSQSEIMALIGQRDLIQGLAQGVFGGNGESSKAREAILSIAVPNLSHNLTQGLAEGLRLDYLSVDYNPFDQFVISAGKTIGKGLVLHAAKQLQSTEFGPLRYELKLVYRLPVADKFFSRVRLGFGTDQSAPWKFSINWTKRF